MPRAVARALRGGACAAGWCLTAAAVLLPTMAHAQSGEAPPADTWRYGLSVYGYLPSIGGSASTPLAQGGPTLNVDAGKIIDALKLTFMASFDANNGRYGFFTDFIYLDLGGAKQGSRDFTINRVPVSGSTAANLDWGLRGVVWTLAGQHRLPTTPGVSMDLFAGARMFSLEPSLRWDIQGSLDGLGGGSRIGEASERETVWDGIVGAKARLPMADRWGLLLYADVGTGQSTLTWQAMGGVSYAFAWGEITGAWRYLSYDFKSPGTVEDLSFNGPMIGATFRW